MKTSPDAPRQVFAWANLSSRLHSSTRTSSQVSTIMNLPNTSLRTSRRVRFSSSLSVLSHAHRSRSEPNSPTEAREAHRPAVPRPLYRRLRRAEEATGQLGNRPKSRCVVVYLSKWPHLTIRSSPLPPCSSGIPPQTKPSSREACYTPSPSLPGLDQRCPP